MPPIRSIAVLFHQRQRDALSAWYRVCGLIAPWRDRGLHVEPVWGIRRDIDADLLIPHLDLSYIPDDYWAFIQRHPNVVNRRVRDVRKSVVSGLLVRPGDGYEGPVIVKTDLNCRGLPEQNLLHPAPTPNWVSRVARHLVRRPWIERRRLGSARTLARYHVFDSVRHVPPAAFRNPHLVVERFCPEKQGAHYLLRTWTFFGDRSRCRIMAAPHPYVKSTSSEIDDTQEPPGEIVQARRRLGLDFGKIDYVIHDGRPLLLDVNRTPGMGRPGSERMLRTCAHLAGGLAYFEQRAPR